MVILGKWPQFKRNNNLHFEFNNLHSGNQKCIECIKHSEVLPLYEWYFFLVGGTMNQSVFGQDQIIGSI